MDSAFNTDMHAAERWPVAVDVAVRVDYPNGPPEHSWLRLEAVPAASAVRITKSRPGLQPNEPELVRWIDLPGETLFARCLSVLAVNLFGSVDMAPRIIGTPLWLALTLDMTLAADDPQALHLEVRTAAPGRASLRWRLRRDAPLQTSVLVLDNLDADPLRATLRLGMALPGPAPVRQRAAAGGTSRSRGKLTAGPKTTDPPVEDPAFHGGLTISSSSA